MRDINGHVIKCDAEVGKPGHWRGCRKAAVWERLSASGYVMHYCDEHKSRAESPTPAQFRPWPGTAARRVST